MQSTGLGNMSKKIRFIDMFSYCVYFIDTFA